LGKDLAAISREGNQPGKGLEYQSVGCVGRFFVNKMAGPVAGEVGNWFLRDDDGR